MANLSKIEKIVLALVLCIALGYFLAPYFAGDKIISPIFAQIGTFEIRWYGILMAVAVGIGYFLVRNLKGRLMTDEMWDRIFLWTVLGGIIGARLLYVLLKWGDYSAHPIEILYIHQGGLSIHGALLGGFLGLRWSLKRTHVELPAALDLLALALPLGQAIGRFGNFFNMEAFGGPTSLPWKMYISPEFRPPALIQNSYFHPTFLYEAIGDILIFLFLLSYNRKPHAAGSVCYWYLLSYSSLRFLVEFFRVDSDTFGALTLAQWASLAVIALSYYLLRKSWKSS